MSYPYPTVLMPYWRRSGGADASGVIEDASGLFDTSAGFANMEPGLTGPNDATLFSDDSRTTTPGRTARAAGRVRGAGA